MRPSSAALAARGRAGNDIIDGGLGRDLLQGQGRNDDILDLGISLDELNKGDNNDIIDVQDGSGGDISNGGFGTDTCFADAGDSVSNWEA